MRRWLAVLLLFSAPALAVDVAGRWWGEAAAGGSTQPVYVTFVQEGNVLKGSGGPSKTDQAVIENGRIDGRKIIFDVVPAGRTPLHFELSPEGEWLKGTIKVQHNGQTVTGTVSLRRRSS